MPKKTCNLLYLLVFLSRAVVGGTTSGAPDATASGSNSSFWTPAIDRIIEAVLRANYVSALLLIVLAALGTLVFALWVLRSVVTTLTQPRGGRRR